MSDRLVTVATFYQPAQGYVLKGRLEAEGIPCFMQDEAASQTQLYAPIVGGAKLQVRESDLARVRRVMATLQDAEGVRFDASGETDGDSAADGRGPGEAESAPIEAECPECGSIEVSRNTLSVLATVLFMLVLLLPCPNLKRRWRCAHCGHQWKV